VDSLDGYARSVVVVNTKRAPAAPSLDVTATDVSIARTRPHPGDLRVPSIPVQGLLAIDRTHVARG